MAIHYFSIPNILLFIISIALTGYLFFIWQHIKQKSSQSEEAVFKKPVRIFVIAYAIYFFVLCLLAGSGFFKVVTMPPRFLVIFLPILLVVLLLAKAKLKGALSFLAFVLPFYLVLIQAFRIFVELVFLQFANEKIIPAELSFHGRNMDLLIGILALPVGYLLYKQHPLARKAAILFNVLGLVSLINIFSIAIPALPSTFRVYDTLYLPTYFPGILIVFLASWAVFLHILSLRQLMGMQKEKKLDDVEEKLISKELLLQ